MCRVGLTIWTQGIHALSFSTPYLLLALLTWGPQSLTVCLPMPGSRPTSLSHQLPFLGQSKKRNDHSRKWFRDLAASGYLKIWHHVQTLLEVAGGQRRQLFQTSTQDGFGTEIVMIWRFPYSSNANFLAPLQALNLTFSNNNIEITYSVWAWEYSWPKTSQIFP